MKKSSKIFLVIIILILICIIGIFTYKFIDFSNKDEKNNEDSKIFSIKDKEFYLFENDEDYSNEYRGMKLLEYDNTNDDYAEIYYILYDYSTDPSFYYSLKVTDEKQNNLLLEEDEHTIIGGIISIIKIKKVNLKDNIIFSLYEKESNTQQITRNVSINLSLKQDLEEKKIINQDSYFKDGVIGNIGFKYTDSKDVYFGTTSHTYSQKLEGENFSVPIKSQYGNYFIQEEHIEFYYNKNVNNLSLEEAFNYTNLINSTLGQYGLSDIYGLQLAGKEDENVIIMSFDEVIKLCQGKTINKNGKRYSKEDFLDYFASITMTKDADLTIGDGIKAIKYHVEANNFQEYLFIYKDNIYTLKVPINERTKTITQTFLSSLTRN